MFDKVYMNVPYEEKDEAKSLGAKWDFELKTWYFIDTGNSHLFQKWLPEQVDVELTDEQKRFIQLVEDGHNVLVDACIGSGKTTSIQKLCSLLISKYNKSILYLTYNKLLKDDARQKIVSTMNIAVHNYHSYAMSTMRDMGIFSSASDCIQKFISTPDVKIKHYDLIVIDEYQDIDAEIAAMLEIIKDNNPGIQIVMVGDMSQKIYDKTTLSVADFVPCFMEKYEFIKFTYCFRICEDLADKLGYAWDKDIKGVNTDCCVKFATDTYGLVDYLAKKEPGDVLCLGKRTGAMARVLNLLEQRYPEKYNKQTVYASIREGDSNITPSKSTAIFTTYDGSKGLEKPVCVVFDFTEDYWASRMSYPNTNEDILRNIFCVAASRGKSEIIFMCQDNSISDIEGVDDEPLVDEHGLLDIKLIPKAMEKYANAGESSDVVKLNISSMFDFKYKEDIEACYNLLDIDCIQHPQEVINIPSSDGMIDLSPCIGVYQEVMYFNAYDIDAQLNYLYNQYPNRPRFIPSSDTIEKEIESGKRKRDLSVEKKILAMTAFETMQSRYCNQVNPNFISKTYQQQIFDRLDSEFDRNMTTIQTSCSMNFINRRDVTRYGTIVMQGKTDVVKNGKIYELKFVSELSHEHFLQLAGYLLATDIAEGVLWNVKNNAKFVVRIKDRLAFAKMVALTITKHRFAVNSPAATCITRKGPMQLNAL